MFALQLEGWKRMRQKSLTILGWAARLLVTVLLMAGSTWAQYNASIEGTVSDASGAAVAQAKVSFENAATHISGATTTDSSGGYRFLSLAPGSYKITVEAGGFSTAST